MFSLLIWITRKPETTIRAKFLICCLYIPVENCQSMDVSRMLYIVWVNGIHKNWWMKRYFKRKKHFMTSLWSKIIFSIFPRSFRISVTWNLSSKAWAKKGMHRRLIFLKYKLAGLRQRVCITRQSSTEIWRTNFFHFYWTQKWVLLKRSMKWHLCLRLFLKNLKVII